MKSSPTRSSSALTRSLASLLILCGAAAALSNAQAPTDAPQGPAVTFGHAGTTKVRVPIVSLTPDLLNTTTLVAVYENFVVLEVPDARAATVAAADASIDLLPDENRVLLNAGPLDTTTPAVKALQQAHANFLGKAMHLIQFAGPIQPAWYVQLEKTGADIVTYIPSNTYLVYGNADQIKAVQTLAQTMPQVQWDGAYRDEYRIDPAVSVIMHDPKQAEVTNQLFAIQLVQDPIANKASLATLNTIKSGKVFNEWDLLNYHNIILPLQPKLLAQVAALPDVVSIQAYSIPVMFDERQDMIVSGNLVGNVPSGPGYLSWLSSRGFTQAQFTASNFVVDVSDSGIDNGSTSPNHFGLYVTGTRPGTSRVAYNRLEGTANGGSTLQGCDGHGNLNSHIVSGYDDFAGFPFADSSGFHFGLGVCPFVKVGSSVIFDPSNFTSPNYANLQSQAYHDNARISTNSWGNTSGNTYNVDSQSYDVLVRDAQPAGSTFPTAGNQEMVIVFANGNSGSGANTVHPPGTAKNIISVGAGENVQAFGGSDGSGIPDSGADSANDIISFSSRGPCSDGRRKPEICAPGTHVSGGVAQAASPSATGTANACYTGSGVSGGVSSIYFPSSGQQFYTASSGTSHSTPCVAGGCALIRQFFINQGMAAPSPAMTKAMLMNSARYMTGTGANDTLWSNSQGMGEMNLGDAFNRGAVTPTIFRDELAADTFTATGQTRTFAGTISDSSKPFRITLAWTDAPGATTGSAANNNLDLSVTIGGNTYKGNVFSGSNSTTGGTADALDNAESVFLPAGVSGSFSITVTAANIVSDGVPNSGGSLDQDFSLVAYNATTTPVISLAGTGANSINDTVGNGNSNGRIDPGETSIQVTVPIINNGSLGATGVTATLVSNTATVSVTSATSAYPNLPASGGTGSNTSPFVLNVSASHPCGSPISLTLNLNSAQGTGTYSFSLPTGHVVGTGGPFTISYTGPAVAIPDNNPTGATANLVVSGLTGTINDLNFRFDGSSCTNAVGATTVGLDHTYVGDLTITLTSPTGTVVTLVSRPTNGDGTASGNNFCSTILDDSAGTSIQTIGATGDPYSGTWSPASPLSAVNGQNPNGTWHLTAIDGAAVDTGNIRAFSLIFTMNNPPTCDPPSSGCTAASVTTSPSPQTVCSGTSASFTVVAGGTAPFTYQWRKNTSNISGANSPTYSIPSTTPPDAGSYDCLVNNSCGGGGVFSTAATLTVNIAPTITQNPSPTTACSGSPATFTANGTGTPSPTFQWRKGGSPINGATSSTFTIPSTTPADTGSYDCLLTNSCGSIPTSSAGLTINTAPTITANPTPQTACVGGSATFMAAGTGTPSPAYQWRHNLANIPGATNQILTVHVVASTDSGPYDCVLTNSCGSIPTSPADLTVNIAPAITANPSDQTVCQGQTFSFTAAASGTPTPTYQWRKDTTNIPGATSPTYSAPAAPGDTGSYDCVITNSCNSATTTPASLTVNTAPAATSGPNPQTACIGQAFSFTITASGSPAPTFQWRLNGNNIPGATSPTYTSNASPTNGGTYDCLLTNSCATTPSSGALLTVNTPPGINSPPSPLEVCEGSPAAFIVTASGSPAPTYQWRKGGNNIPGATASTYSIPSAAPGDAGSYDCLLTNSCATISTTPVSLTVDTAPQVVSSPTDQSACDGGSVTFMVSGSGTPAPTYQWRKNLVAIPGANSPSLTISPVSAADASPYDCVLTNSCSTATSSPATLTVTVGVAITSPPAPETVAAGSDASFSVSASGDAPLSFQWRKDTTPLTDTGEFMGSSTSTLTISPATTADMGNYDCIVSNACGPITSPSAPLAISHCGSADFNHDGDIGTDSDIEAFFSCLGGNCCPTCDSADFNGDGDIGTDSDIEAFFRVLGGGPC